MQLLWVDQVLEVLLPAARHRQGRDRVHNVSQQEAVTGAAPHAAGARSIDQHTGRHGPRPIGDACERVYLKTNVGLRYEICFHYCTTRRNIGRNNCYLEYMRSHSVNHLTWFFFLNDVQQKNNPPQAMCPWWGPSQPREGHPQTAKIRMGDFHQKRQYRASLYPEMGSRSRSGYIDT